MNSESRSKSFFRHLQLYSAFFGILLSLYLLAQHTRLKSGIQGGSSFCSIGKYADCDIVSSSPYAAIFGIPLAGIGALFYFALLLLILLTPRKSKGFPAAQTWLTRLAVAGLGADALLVAIQIGLIRSACLVCFATYLANLGVLLGALVRRGGKFRVALRSALRLDPAADGLIPQGPLRTLLGISLVLFTALVSVMPSAIRLTSKNYALVDGAIEQFFQGWPEKKARLIDTKPGDGVRGDPKASVRIVEFSDFECPHCRSAAFTLHTALDPFKDQTFFVFKQYPLDPACNPTVQQQVHPNACSLARLAYCANRKGKFWDFHDAIFISLSQETVAAGLASFGPKLSSIFTPEEIASCLSDPATLDNIALDAKLGRALELRGTPALFVNGKAVTIPLTIESLRRLVALELSLLQKTAP